MRASRSASCPVSARRYTGPSPSTRPGKDDGAPTPARPRPAGPRRRRSPCTSTPKRERERPGHVVVGRVESLVGRVLLRRQQVERVAAVRLVHPHDERARGIAPLRHAERLPGARHLDPVRPQEIHHRREPPRSSLLLRDHDRVRLLGLALAHRVAPAPPEVAHHRRRVRRRRTRAPRGRRSPCSWCCRAATSGTSSGAAACGTSPARSPACPVYCSSSDSRMRSTVSAVPLPKVS